MRGWIAGLLLAVLGSAGMMTATGVLPPPGDSGDSGGGDSGMDTGDTGGNEDSGPTGDTASPGDTADTGRLDDTGLPDPVYSAAQVAGEKGGFSCTTSGGAGTAGAVWALVLGAALRRRTAPGADEGEALRR